MDQTTLQMLRDAYSRMQVIRVVEEKAVELTKGDSALIAGSIHPCAGQEAIPVGALAGLTSNDRVVATYRGHGWALACGITPFEVLAEICQKHTGINGGRAGSLMISDSRRGFIGQNSIVGAGGPIACGAAIAARAQGTRRVVAVSFGDGAISQGGMHEALVMAASERLGVIFVCENNGWAEMTPNSYVNSSPISQRAAAYGMRSLTVDGCDPLQVRNAVSEAAEIARNGGGPTFLECTTVRLWGHYNKDIQHYRSMTDRHSAEARDPIKRLRLLLEQSGLSGDEIDAIDKSVVDMVQAAADESRASPNPDPASLKQFLFAPAASPRAGATIAAKTEKMTYAAAVNRALHDAMDSREDVILFGEDVAKPGGVFGLSRNLLKKFGAARVFDTPIAETSILGSAVGAAIEGSRPVAEVMFGDFLLVALDQLINQAANVRYVSNGRSSAPLVVRTQQGVTPGSCAQHSQCLEGLLAAIPGLKVGLPSTPNDAYNMLRAAIEDPDPVVLFEARSLFMKEGNVSVGGNPETVSGARSLRDGSDVAIVTWGTAIYSALEAADLLQAETGLQASVLDLRWLSPIDDDAIKKVVHASGRVLVVHDAARTGGFGAEIAARITERHFAKLESPVCRIGGRGCANALFPNIAASGHSFVGKDSGSAERSHKHQAGCCLTPASEPDRPMPSDDAPAEEQKR